MRTNIFRSTILLLLIPFCGIAQTKLEKKSFLDGKLELLVPTYFKPMAADVLDAKYPDRNHQPNLVLTDNDAEVNIVISYVPQQPLQDDQMAAYKDFQISSLKRMHPDAKWLESGVKTVNGKNIGYFKFTSSGADQPVFNYYFFTNMNGKVLLLTFNCPEKLLPKWKDTVETIVSSLTVK